MSPGFLENKLMIQTNTHKPSCTVCRVQGLYTVRMDSSINNGPDVIYLSAMTIKQTSW